MVSIAAFQAVDPGSIPGRRKTFVASVHLFIYIQELGQYPHGKKYFRYRELNPGHLGESQVS